MFLSKAHFCKIIVSLLISCFLFSCVSTRQSVYFHDLPDTTLASVKENLEPIIQKNDILQITVSSSNMEDAVIYNAPSMATIGTAVPTGPTATGYLVDEAGNIQYPVLGPVKVDGLTTAQLTKYIREQLLEKKLLVDPVVSVRFLNYRITVIGEVNRPQVVNVSNERISILEALGLAGDITVYGRKENVLLIRETDGVRTVKRLNLNDRSILSSPYYYLHSNDVVYVEPNKAKVASTVMARQTLPIVISGLTLIVIFLDRIVFNNN